MKERTESFMRYCPYCNKCSGFSVITVWPPKQSGVFLCWDQLTTNENTWFQLTFFPFLTSPTWFYMDYCVKHTPVWNPEHTTLGHTSPYLDGRDPSHTHTGSVRAQRAQQTGDRVCLLLPVAVCFSAAGVCEPVLQRHHLHPHRRCRVRPRTVLWQL